MLEELEEGGRRWKRRRTDGDAAFKDIGGRREMKGGTVEIIAYKEKVLI